MEVISSTRVIPSIYICSYFFSDHLSHITCLSVEVAENLNDSASVRVMVPEKVPRVVIDMIPGKLNRHSGEEVEVKAYTYAELLK